MKPTIDSLGSFITSLQYGPGSAASPQKQITAAFAEYDAARQAALANPNAQTASAFQNAASSYLPMAREFYGSGGGYAAAVETAIGTAQQLQGLLQPQSMPDLTPVIVAGAAATVEAVETLTTEVRALRCENSRLNAWLQVAVPRAASAVP